MDYYLILKNGYVIATAHNYESMMEDWDKERVYNPNDLVSVVKISVKEGALEEVQNYMTTFKY